MSAGASHIVLSLAHCARCSFMFNPSPLAGPLGPSYAHLYSLRQAMAQAVANAEAREPPGFRQPSAPLKRARAALRRLNAHISQLERTLCPLPRPPARQRP